MNEEVTSYVIAAATLDFLSSHIDDLLLQKRFVNAIHYAMVDDRSTVTRFRLELTKNEASRLVSALLSELSAQGLDEKSEPNQYGIYIESLIDVFGQQD